MQAMRTLFVMLYLLLTTLRPTRLSAADTWAVVASPNLDPRIVNQLKELAAQNNAEVRLISSAEEPSRLQPKLTIELNQENNLDSFLQRLNSLAPNSSSELTPDLAREGFDLQAVCEHEVGLKRIVVTAADARGFHNALLRVPDLPGDSSPDGQTDLIPSVKGYVVTKSGRTTIVNLADYPSFPERGIVEGFYGVPWSHQDRLDILRFVGQHRMNVYYYAPKDDPYHRKLWREPYPPNEVKRLGELVDTARANFVDFCFAISPGLSMVYSNDLDFSTLTKKLDSVQKLGVSCFALFLDDVPQDLENPEDKARFKTLAAAHVYLVNKLDGYLKSQSPDTRLTVTPTTYTNEWGSRDYIRELGSGLDPDVGIVWTGPRVVSPAIKVAEAREWGDLLHQPPLVWDNFPVNDGISWRLNLGPLVGREPNLPTAVRGLFSNPMNQARASLIPLQTIADYLWNSLAYDPERSLRNAVMEQYGKDAPELLNPFLKIYGDYWWQENVFKPLFVEERKVIDTAEIEQQISQLESALRSLRSQDRFQKLVTEISPFLPRTRDRLALVRTDPAFRHLPGQKLQWREDYDLLYASRLRKALKLDGSFAKWRRFRLYPLFRRSQIIQGSKLWRGSRQFSIRVGLAWDEDYLYVGVDVTDPKLFQPFQGRGIDKGDAFILMLETAFRKKFESTQADVDEYHLFFSPGNFSGVKPSVFSDEDYLPPRPQPRDYNREIKTAWKKTRAGFSGDIAIPVSYFDAGPSSAVKAGGAFRPGYEIGLSFAAQKVIPSKKADQESERIVFASKTDRIFPLRFGNPSSYQRLVLVDAQKAGARQAGRRKDPFVPGKRAPQ